MTKKETEAQKKARMNRENIAAFRARQKELGRKQTVFYLTPEEKIKVESYLKKLRKEK